MNIKVLHAISRCTECALCKNQRPLLDTPAPAEVFWVGLSAVKVDDIGCTRPLASDTRTGKLVEDIETQLANVSFYRTNLVKCFPAEGGKIRYPKRNEMRCCFQNLMSEVKEVAPRVVLLLGKQVAKHVLTQHDIHSFSLDSNFSFKEFSIDGVVYVPIHHPSYVLIYHRRRLHTYIENICKIICGLCSTSKKRKPNRTMHRIAIPLPLHSNR